MICINNSLIVLLWDTDQENIFQLTDLLYRPVKTSDGSVEYMLSRRSSELIGP